MHQKYKSNRKRILIICTGNSCRSQMAEGWLRSFDKSMDVFSAGTHPEKVVNPFAVRAMKEVGIDISNQKPEHVDRFLNDNFDFVITVCDNARIACPLFKGNINKQIHIGFDDPAEATGTEEEMLQVYRRVRDEIKTEFNYEPHLQ